MRRLIIPLVLLTVVSSAFSRNDFEYNSRDYNYSATFSMDHFDIGISS